MNAQIIPFPVPHARAQAERGIEGDPLFWAFCELQNRRAGEMGKPLPLYVDLVDRYRRGERCGKTRDG